MPARLDADLTKQIVRMRALDYTKKEIAEELNISRSTVQRRLEEFRKVVEAQQEIETMLDGLEKNH